MRISTNYQYESFQYDIQTAMERLSRTSQELSSGKRIQLPSDDPTGVGQTIGMRSLRSSMDQYQANLKLAQGTLGYADSTFGDISTLLQRANELAINGANGTTDQAGRDAMATEIATIQSQLIGLANIQGPTGNYLFSGQKTATKPYALVNNVLTFSGDTNNVTVEGGPGQMLTVSTPGEPTISTIYNNLEELKTDLQGGQLNRISSTDIANIQVAIKQVHLIRGDVGTRMQAAQDLTSQWQRRSDELTTRISDVEDADIAQTALSYQQAQQAYTAALTVAGQGFRLSLMDFIK